MRKRISALFLAAGMLAAPSAASAWHATTPSAATAQAITLSAEQKSTSSPTPAQQALRVRQKKCGAEWKAAKAAGKIEKGMKWPQFWSACNSRLKNGG